MSLILLLTTTEKRKKNAIEYTIDQKVHSCTFPWIWSNVSTRRIAHRIKPLHGRKRIWNVNFSFHEHFQNRTPFDPVKRRTRIAGSWVHVSRCDFRLCNYGLFNTLIYMHPSMLLRFFQHAYCICMHPSTQLRFFKTCLCSCTRPFWTDSFPWFALSADLFFTISFNKIPTQQYTNSWKSPVLLFSFLRCWITVQLYIYIIMWIQHCLEFSMSSNMPAIFSTVFKTKV